MDNQTPTQIPTQAPPVATPQPQPAQTPTSPKKSFLSTKIILIIAIILIIFVGGTTTYVAFVNQEKPTPTPTPEIVKSPTPTPDPTASWKTYVDDIFKFSLKYPKNFELQQSPEEPMGHEFNLYEIPKGNPSIIRANAKIYREIYTVFLPSYITFENMYASPSGSVFIFSNDVFGNQKITKNKNRFTQNKKTFGYIRNSLPIDPANPEIGAGYYIELQPGIVMILETSGKDKMLLDQILSTFKFTDASQALSQKDIEEIKIAVAQKDGQPLNNEHITFDSTNEKYNGLYATGQVGPLNGGGGAKWFASRINNQWIIVWIGNGLPTCVEIAKYNLPEDFISCY